jgi:hypothetical protein
MFDLVKKLLIIVLIPLMVQAQVAEDSSHLKNNQPKWVAAGLAAGYTAGIVILSKYWYQQYPSEPFHFFNDNAEWLQMDKAGHLFTAYTAANWSHALWKTTGMNPRQSALAGAISSVVFVSALEVLDGHSSEWGFSGGDMLANLLGAGLMLGQEWGWNHQRIQLKFSYLPVDYSLTAVQGRADALFGSRGIEKMLKDYNGQTYWASFNLASFFSKSSLPKWLNVSLGYGAGGMLGGRENIQKDANGNILFNRSDIARVRKWYLSADIDLTSIPTRKKWVKTVFCLLNSVKIPAPALEWSAGNLRAHWIKF